MLFTQITLQPLQHKEDNNIREKIIFGGKVFKPTGYAKKAVQKDGKSFYICPFPYKRYNPDTGRTHFNPGDNTFWDDRSNARYCSYGKGTWCGNCMHYNQHKKENSKWKREFERIKKTGKAPWLWHKPTARELFPPV